MIESALREDERGLLEGLRHEAGWTVATSEGDVTARRGDVGIRFSPDRSPVVVAGTLPDDYPYALAAFVYQCVRYKPADWWLERHLATAEQWRRLAPGDTRVWLEIFDWLPRAPRDLIDLAALTAARLQPDVRSDEDAHRAAQELRDAIVAAPTYSRMSTFLAHLDPRQGLIAEQLLDAGAGIEVFWGPEQMDVWKLTLRRGDTLIEFGIERGISDGVRVDHRRLRGRGAPPRWLSYPHLWHVWAVRTGAIRGAIDPFEFRSDPEAWATVLDWLDNATDDDVTAIDALVLEERAMMSERYGRSRRDVPVEERIARAERAIRG